MAPNINNPGGVKNDPDVIIDGVTTSPAISQGSQVYGWGTTLQHTLPDRLATETSGGGSVIFVRTGARMDPGSTSGDEAKLKGLAINQFESLAQIRGVVMFEKSPSTGDTNDVAIGLCGSTAPDPEGAYIDLLNDTYNVNGTTKPLPSLPSLGGIVVTVDIDYTEGETRFQLSGAVSDSAIISGTAGPSGPVVAMESKGGFEGRLQVVYASQILFEEAP